MDRLHEIEVFVAVAEAGGFAKAARRLRLSPPAVTRAVAALEERLGARVFQRTTRNLVITEVGRRFLETARRILADLDAAEKEAVGTTTVPQGHLTVTASPAFGRAMVAPVVGAFLDRHPRVTVSLLLLDRLANLVDEGIDVAVRIAHLPNSSLVARKVGMVRRLLVASPDYLARRGVPRTPHDLRLHAVVAFTGLMPDRAWRYADGTSTGTVSFMPRLEVNDALAAVAAAEAGEGITVSLSYMVADAIRAGRLVPVLDAFAPPPVPVHLVHPESRLVSPRIRAFVDFAAPLLKERLERRGLDGQPGRAAISSPDETTASPAS
jgi:DNA-binding transcriptional LysR family regulator